MAKKRQQFTFKDVKKASQEKGVELLSEKIDQNKRVYADDKMLIRAKICLHEKTLSLNNLQYGFGINYCQLCYQQQSRLKYGDIVTLLENNGCKILVTEQEYYSQRLSTRTGLDCIVTCGHQCKIHYSYFQKQNQINKRVCKKCSDKDKAQKRCQNLMEKNLQLAKNICAENNIQYINSVQEKTRDQVYILKCQSNHQFTRKIRELKNNYFCTICNKDKTICQQNINTGDYHEQCVFNFLKDHCKTIEIVGNTGNLYDIIYTLDDDIKRGIQVKTLVQIKYKDNVFGCRVTRYNRICYPKDTLMIFINQKSQKFFVDMSQNFTTNSITIFFNSNKCKYQNTKFTDQNLFIQRLISLLPQASEIDVSKMYPSDTLKEINCFERLKKKCTELGLSFQRNTTNGGPIDCYINQKAIQVKYREGDYKKNVVQFGLYKSGGTKNGKHTHIPYADKDEIQYFVFEYGGQNGKFLDNFCILSKEFLIQNKFISTTDSKGKISIFIWKPDRNSDKDKIGTSEYWNKFDQLQ